MRQTARRLCGRPLAAYALGKQGKRLLWLPAMSFIALLSAGDAAPGETPPGLVEVAGLSLLERQVRQVLKAGAALAVVVAAALPDAVAQRLHADSRVRRVATADAAHGQLGCAATPIGAVLLLAPGILLDERLVSSVARAERIGDAPTLLVFDAEPPSGAERIDAHAHWAGAALIPLSLVHETLRDLGEWELSGTLLRAAVGAGAGRIAVESLPLYAPARRRAAPMLWARPTSAAAADDATEAVIAAAQKGCLDWPARWIHPRIENQLVRWLLPTPITPNMVTCFTAILGVAATVLFAMGQLWWGLALVLLIGPLDGVDGKLARARHDFSRWGDLEHVLDKAMEYAWYLALGFWFASTGQGAAAWLAAGGIIVFALSEALKGEYFRRFTGRQLDDWGAFERRFRLVAGRRNTFFWTLVPFAALGAWWAGFLTILAYAAITFAVAEWRFLLALRAYAVTDGEKVAANFAATAYDFLPRA